MDRIKEINGTVDAIPSELSYVFANNLDWSPNTVIQVYNSDTRFIDRWNGQHYLDITSPDFLIVEFFAIDGRFTIDGRNLLLDSPAVTKSILRNYTIDREDLKKNLILLRKRPQELAEELTIIGNEIHLDRWISVPPSDRLLFAGLDIHLSPLGYAHQISVSHSAGFCRPCL